MSTPEQQAIIAYLKKNLTIELDKDYDYIVVYLRLEGEIISEDNLHL